MGMTKAIRTALMLAVLNAIFFSTLLHGESVPLPLLPAEKEVFVRNIIFRGNESIPEEILLQMMNMATNTALEYGKIRAAVERVREHYLRQGYTKSTIAAAYVRLDGVLEMVIDEGRINTIRILNKNIYSIYSFKQELQIAEGDVFNHIIVEQELERIRRKFNLKELKFTLKANQALKGSFDLYIMTDSWKGRSFGFVLDNDGFSLVPRLAFRDHDFWGLDHEISVLVEARLAWLEINRRRASLDYYLPSFLGKKLRPYIHLEKKHEKKSRDDIDVRYWEDNLIIGLFMENRLGERFRISSGLMHDHYRLFDLKTGKTPTLIADADYTSLGYYQAQLMFELREPEGHYRKDKHFYANLKLDYLFHEHEENFFMLQLEIRKMFQLKLDDLMFRFNEMHIFTGKGFYRDYDLAKFTLRGYGSGNLFTRHAWMLSSEYRLALYRDIFKYLFFLDSALYLPVRYDTKLHNEKLRARASLGQGIEFNFHEWSAKVYYGVPFDKKILEGKVHLAIQKVF